MNADFKIRIVNPAALPAFGDIPGGVIGRDFDEIMHILWHKEYADQAVRIFSHKLVPATRTSDRKVRNSWDRGTKEYYEGRVDRILLPDGRSGVRLSQRPMIGGGHTKGLPAVAVLAGS